jgi:hypothetical protein
MANNTEVVEQAYAAFGRGDIPAVMSLLADDVTWTSPRTLPHGGEFHGPSEVGKFFQGLGAAWDPLTLDVAQVGAIGDVVVGVVRADGTRRGGKPDSYAAVHVFRVAGGKIVSFREYVDIDAPIS